MKGSDYTIGVRTFSIIVLNRIVKFGIMKI